MSENQGAAAPISPLEKFEPILKPLREAYDDRIAAFPVGKYGVVVFRFATGQEIRLFRRKLRSYEKLPTEGKDDATEEAQVDFVRSMIVHPTDREEARRIIEDYFQLVPTAALAINRISGMGVEELGKA